MDTYIKKFVAVLPKSQQDAIQTLITKSALSGKVSSYQDLLSQIQTLSNKLNTQQPTPILNNVSVKQHFNARDLNNIVDMTRADLSAIFDGLDQLGNIFEQLNRIIELDKITFARQINDIDNNLASYTYLDFGFVDQYTSTVGMLFDSPTSGLLDWNDPLARTLYRDPKTNKIFGQNNLLSVSYAQSSATLPVNSIERYTPQRVYSTSDYSSAYSFQAVRIANSSVPSNIIDNLLEIDQSIWNEFIFLPYKQGQTSPVDTMDFTVNLEFMHPINVNYLEIVPALDTKFTITSIEYLGVDNEFHSYYSDSTVVNRSTLIQTELTLMRALRLNITVDTHQWLETELTLDDNRAILAKSVADYIQGINPYTNILVNYLGGNSPSSKIDLKGWLYTIGIEKLVAGKVYYDSVGIGASNILTSSKPVTRVIVHNESMLPFNDTDTLLSSETWLWKQDYNAAGTVINTVLYPMLSLESSTVVHDFLVFNTSSAQAKLMWYPDIGETFEVRRNVSTVLTAGVDYQVSNDSGVTFSTFPAVTDPVGPPYTYIVKLLNYDPNSVYTVLYTPLFDEISAGLPLYLDNKQCGVFNSDHSITFSYDKPELSDITYSKLSTVLILRSLDHTANRFTATVDNVVTLVR